jgi:hypothetical protein
MDMVTARKKVTFDGFSAFTPLQEHIRMVIQNALSIFYQIWKVVFACQ